MVHTGSGSPRGWVSPHYPPPVGRRWCPESRRRPPTAWGQPARGRARGLPETACSVPGGKFVPCRGGGAGKGVAHPRVQSLGREVTGQSHRPPLWAPLTTGGAGNPLGQLDLSKVGTSSQLPEAASNLCLPCRLSTCTGGKLPRGPRCRNQPGSLQEQRPGGLPHFPCSGPKEQARTFLRILLREQENK